jgi:hypothetical protein
VKRTLDPRALPLLLLALSRGWFWTRIPFANEDAYITFRYARSWVRGLGPVFNEGERVLGTTSPLWMAWSAPESPSRRFCGPGSRRSGSMLVGDHRRAARPTGGCRRGRCAVLFELDVPRRDGGERNGDSALFAVTGPRQRPPETLVAVP